MENSAAPEFSAESIGDIVDDFIKHIRSLHDSLGLSMYALSELRMRAQENYDEFTNEHTEPYNNDEEELLVESSVLGRFRAIKRQLESANISHRVVPQTFLVSLVSQYDAFLGSLISYILFSKPEILNSSDRKVNFSQLSNFGSIEEAREYIVEKEVENILRNSHSDHFDWMERNFGVPLRKDLESWSDFIEITQRRHLFVHADGNVSRQYLSVCEEHGVNLDDDICHGDQLVVPPEYFNNAYEIIFEIGVKLAHVLWRKQFPSEREDADDNLIHTTYELLKLEEYSLAQEILDFCTNTVPKYSSERSRRMFVVNRSIAYKFDGKEEVAESILDDEDWSATSGNFQLAEAVLRDEFQRSAHIMRQVGPDNELIPRGAYKEWPLFRDFRESDEFLQAYEDVFGEPFTNSDKVEESAE
jgi:hypothetical protein